MESQVFPLVMCQCLRNVRMVERCVRFFVFERDQLEHYTILHADAANRIFPGTCISIEISIYLSFYLSFDLSICIFLHFKENRAVCPLVALLYVRRYVRSCCLFRMSLGLIFPLAFCLLLQNLVSSALSCLRVFLNSISALAGVLLSLCYLCAISCYLCAIYAISGGGQCFDLCYLCAIYAISCSGELFALCYLCAISVLSMLSHAISVLSLWYLLNISLKSVAFTQTDAEDAAHPEGHAPQSRLAGVRGDWGSSHALVLVVHMQWAFVKETMRGNGFAISCICVSTYKRTIFIIFQYHALILAVCPLNDIYRKRCDRYQDKHILCITKLVM